MNKIACLAVLVLLALSFAGPLRAGTLTLVKPNGGESLTLGQANCQVQWSAVGVVQNVRINLLKGGTVVGSIANSLPPGSSPFLWTAGRLADGTTVQAGSDYKVRVRAIESSEVDDSDGLFSLVDLAPPPPPPTALQLKKPNGGNALLLHKETEVAWKSIAPAMVGKVRLQLMKEGCCTIGILAENLPATGTFAWKAGEYPGNTAPAGKYRIRVSSMDDPKIYDESDAAFELNSFTGLASKAQPMKFLQGETVPGVYVNYPCHDTFPGKISPPVHISVLQQGWQQMFGSACSGLCAWVGAYWFPYQSISVASIYRSRILFSLSKYVDKLGALKSAKLKMKRIHSVHEDANSGCGCTENLWVLEAPMSSCAIPAIGQRIDISLETEEFTRDVTEIVRQWLDGSLVNHGLLLLAGESPCSGGRKCASCYEASLILNFD